MEQRNKRRTIIAVAAGRELAGFCWAVATADQPAAGTSRWSSGGGEPGPSRRASVRHLWAADRPVGDTHC
jgi:hypothetical protein